MLLGRNEYIRSVGILYDSAVFSLECGIHGEMHAGRTTVCVQD